MILKVLLTSFPIKQKLNPCFVSPPSGVLRLEDVPGALLGLLPRWRLLQEAVRGPARINVPHPGSTQRRHPFKELSFPPSSLSRLSLVSHLHFPLVLQSYALVTPLCAAGSRTPSGRLCRVLCSSDGLCVAAAVNVPVPIAMSLLQPR